MPHNHKLMCVWPRDDAKRLPQVHRKCDENNVYRAHRQPRTRIALLIAKRPRAQQRNAACGVQVGCSQSVAAGCCGRGCAAAAAAPSNLTIYAHRASNTKQATCGTSGTTSQHPQTPTTNTRRGGPRVCASSEGCGQLHYTHRHAVVLHHPAIRPRFLNEGQWREQSL